MFGGNFSNSFRNGWVLVLYMPRLASTFVSNIEKFNTKSKWNEMKRRLGDLLHELTPLIETLSWN